MLLYKQQKDLQKCPVLFDELDFARDKPIQGDLGDCWFISACTCLSANKNLINRIVPLNQPLFGADNYVGLVKCFFWQFGHWESVLIDDFLPTTKNNGQLLFSRCNDSRQFWVPLIEKAYAK